MITLNGVEVESTKFPNNEVKVKSCFDGKIVQVIVLKWKSDQDLINLMFIRKELPKDCYVKLRIYYMPYSRMDRRIDGCSFTLKYICDFINWLNFDEVILYEPHSDVSPALLDNCKVVQVAKKLFHQSDISPDYVLYPDAGAEKRYSISGYNSLLGIKQRDHQTGRISRYEIVGDIHPQSSVIILDDLCSYGGTFKLAAKELKRRGASFIYLIVAHCERSIFEGGLLESGLIEKVLTTNTILDLKDQNEKLTVFDINKI